MGPKRFYSQNFSLFIVKFNKLGFYCSLNNIFPSRDASSLFVPFIHTHVCSSCK